MDKGKIKEIYNSYRVALATLKKRQLDLIGDYKKELDKKELEKIKNN